MQSLTGSIWTHIKAAYVSIDCNSYTPLDLYNNPGEFRLPVGSVISFYSDDYLFYVTVDGNDVFGLSRGSYSYTVVSDCSIRFRTGDGYRWQITTSGTSSVVGDFDTPTVTVSANPATTTPLTIQMLVLPSGSSFWYAIDTEGNQYSFDPVSNLALNRSFVVHTYTAEEVANLDNFPSGYWMVSWSGSSQYITVKFEEYSKFFLWLNRFLINFSLAVFTVGLALIPVCFRFLSIMLGHTIGEVDISTFDRIRGVTFGSTVSKKYRISENRKNDVR